MARVDHRVWPEVTSSHDPCRLRSPWVLPLGTVDLVDLDDIVADHGCESLHLTADPATGLRALVAVHSTVLGPGLGGTRFRPYPDLASAAVDVCRLARGMTYKHAACGNDQGGGKAVIIGDPATLRTEAL